MSSEAQKMRSAGLVRAALASLALCLRAVGNIQSQLLILGAEIG